MWVRVILLAFALAGLGATPDAAEAREKSAKDQALYEKALKDCTSPRRANRAWPQVNYKAGTYRCVESKTR
ncbi:MAG: hypothetical protein IOC86_03730 [Aestuariivirga sp.]|nr:hypothetical protein [Aestuariivirga sp.]